MKTMAGNQKFRRATERPEWVSMLSDDVGEVEQESRFHLDEFLSERRLEGVAYIKIDE